MFRRQTDESLRIVVYHLHDEPGFTCPVMEYEIPVHDVVFSPDLKCFVTACHTDTSPGVELKEWDMNTGKELTQVTRTDLQSWIALRRSGPAACLFIVRKFAGSTWSITDLNKDGKEDSYPVLVVSPDGKCLVTQDYAGTELWDAVSLQKRGKLVNPGDRTVPLGKIVFSPNCEIVALPAGQKVGKRDPVSRFLSARVLGTKSDNEPFVTRVWDTQTATELAVLPDCTEVIYSPDGALLATIQDNRTATIWDVPPRKPILGILGVSAAIWLALLGLGWLGKRGVRRYLRWSGQ